MEPLLYNLTSQEREMVLRSLDRFLVSSCGWVSARMDERMGKAGIHACPLWRSCTQEEKPPCYGLIRRILKSERIVLEDGV